MMLNRYCSKDTNNRFFNIMLEDFRHKIWMLALSIIGNVLALPMAFLLTNNGSRYGETEISKITNHLSGIFDYFSRSMLLCGGFIAIAGALIVAFAGFYFVFHKNMIDTWHSLPVKRRTLFSACWLNGFLIWFVPFIISLVITMVIGMFKCNALIREGLNLGRIPQSSLDLLRTHTAGELAATAMLNGLYLIVAFLLVYNLTLVALMFCGNFLSAFLYTAVFGTGSITVFGLITWFSGYYFNTFNNSTVNHSIDAFIYTSPFAAVFNLLLRAAKDRTEANSFLGATCICGLEAVALGLLAMWLYKRRKSELAEQGTKNKPVRLIVQIVTCISAVLAGWMIFAVLSNDVFSVESANGSIAWCVFGGVLFGCLTFGVLNVVFSVDFKAFFERKWIMLGAMAAGFVICTAFHFEIINYDTYLPRKEDIAEIAVMGMEFTSAENYSYHSYAVTNDYEENTVLQNMHIKDKDMIYDFLETAVECQKLMDREKKEKSDDNYLYVDKETGIQTFIETGNIFAKVTLENGRIYCRNYTVRSDNADAAYQLLTSTEYLTANFIVPEEEMKNFDTIELRRNYDSPRIKDISGENMKRFFEAYHKDLLEYRDRIITGEGNLLGTAIIYKEGYYYSRRKAEIYSFMEETVKVLADIGLESQMKLPEPEDVEKLKFDFYGLEGAKRDGVMPIEVIADDFGVYPPEVLEMKKERREKQEQEMEDEFEEEFDKPAAEIYESYEYIDEPVTFDITDKEEISEILKLISMDNVYWNIYRRYSTSFQLVDTSGREYYVFIKEGDMPMKYIERFAKQYVGKEAVE